jgi:hypothetical protein
MTFSYDANALDTSAISRVRLKVGDWLENNGVLPGGKNFADEELQFFLDENTQDETYASIQAIESAMSQWATMADTRIGPQYVAYSAVYKALSERHEKLVQEAAGGENGAVFTPLRRADEYSSAFSNVDTDWDVTINRQETDGIFGSGA